MSGEEMKTYLKQRGLSLASVAEELGTSPQNLNGKLKAKSLKSDFISAIKAIIDRCAPPLPAEMEAAVIGSNVNGSNSSNVSQSISSDAALVRELELLKKMVADKDEEIKFLRAQLSTKISGSV